MKNYLVTFSWQHEMNCDLAVAIRSKLELHSPKMWIHIFPNQLVIKSDLEISGIYDLLQPEAEKTNIFIVEFSNYFTNATSRKWMLKDYEY